MNRTIKRVIFPLACGAFVGLGLVYAYDAQSNTTLSASYYSEELRGSPTATGEPFNPDGFTAAHKTLPLGSRLTVCKDSCVQVRINDRGPVNRDLDLSRAAADAVGLTEEGVGEVKVEETSKPITELPATGGPSNGSGEASSFLSHFPLPSLAASPRR